MQSVQLDRSVSTPTLRSKKLPPVDFFPSGSPLHNTYNNLLRRAAAKSRGSTREHAEVSLPGMSPVQRGSAKSHRRTPEAFPPPSAAGSDSRASSRQTDAIENLHFTGQLLRRAANDALGGLSGTANYRKNSTPASRSRQSSGLMGSETRLDLAIDHGATADDLRKNQELVEVLNDVQQVTICFQEIIRHLSFHRVETGRVLWKLQSTYINLFERIVSAMYRSSQKKETTLLQEGTMRDQEMDLLRLRVLDMTKRLEAGEKGKQAQQAMIDTDQMRIKSMEAEIDDLRAALVAEVRGAQTEAQRRVQEDAEIRKKIEVRLDRFPCPPSAYFLCLYNLANILRVRFACSSLDVCVCVFLSRSLSSFLSLTHRPTYVFEFSSLEIPHPFRANSRVLLFLFSSGGYGTTTNKACGTFWAQWKWWARRRFREIDWRHEPND